MYRALFFLAAVLAAGAGVLIGALNSERATLDLLFVQITWPQGLIVVATFVCGLLFGVGATWLLRVLPLSLRQRRLERSGDTVAETDSDTDHA